MVELGVLAEQSGWEAAFGWEAIYGLNPWVILGGIAARTERIRLGTLLTPPSTRRPWKLASEVATLDRLSDGRAVLIAGLGALEVGFTEVGEESDRKVRAEIMDESLELIEKFWTGDPFVHAGKYYNVDWSKPRIGVQPVQQPRVPIWVVAKWPAPRSMRRSYRLDGVLPFKATESNPYAHLEPADVEQLLADARANRDSDAFDIVIEGTTPLGDTSAMARVSALSQAGATWWVESMWEDPGGIEAVRRRIAAGPPTS